MLCKACKKTKHGETRNKTNGFNSKFACILEASEPTRLPKYREDHIAGKGDNSLPHYNMTHKFILVLQAMKIPAAKAAVDNGENWKIFWPGTRQSQKQIRWSMMQGRQALQFILPHWWTSVICRMPNWRKHQKYKGQVVFRGDVVKDDSGSYAVFAEQRSSASQMTAAKVIMRLGESFLLGMLFFWFFFLDFFFDFCGRLFDFVFCCCCFFCVFFWLCSVWKIQSFLLNGIHMVIFWQDSYGKGNLRKSFCSTVGRKFQIGNTFSYNVKKDCSYLFLLMT